MKVDIEGAEIDFLSAHSDLLARTSNVIVEWHKWIVDYATLDEVMRRHGFLLNEVLHEDQHAGVALYERGGNA